ncbi:MAG: hypothetical protein WB988_25690 [Candidatus Nitrosopolaris sp.]|jgi:small multidrug resistance family-3 protein
MMSPESYNEAQLRHFIETRGYMTSHTLVVLSSIVWGAMVDKKNPDRYEILGSLIAVIGAAIIFYAPR